MCSPLLLLIFWVKVFSLCLWMFVWVYLVQFQLFCYNALLPHGWFFFFQRIFISFYVLTHTFDFLILVLYECDLHFLFLLLSWEGLLSLRVDFFYGSVVFCSLSSRGQSWLWWWEGMVGVSVTYTCSSSVPTLFPSVLHCPISSGHPHFLHVLVLQE